MARSLESWQDELDDLRMLKRDARAELDAAFSLGQTSAMGVLIDQDEIDAAEREYAYYRDRLRERERRFRIWQAKRGRK